jgi:hypothetical protein
METFFKSQTDLKVGNKENFDSSDLEVSCASQTDKEITLVNEKKVSEDECQQNKNGEKEHKIRHKKRKK